MPEQRPKIRRRADLAKQREAGPANELASGPKGARALKPTGSSLPLLRNSERSTFKTCRFQWSVSYGAKKKPGVASPALRFGTLWHAALALHYIPGIKRGENPVDAFTRLYEADAKLAGDMGWKDDDGKWGDMGEMGVLMMQNYLDEYGNDDQWEVLVTEQPFRTLVYHPFTCAYEDIGEQGVPRQYFHEPDCRCGKPWFYYVGVIDGVWRYRPDKKLWIPDHKTTDGIGDKKWSHLALDDQAGGYWTFGVDWLRANGFLKDDQRLAGMLYNLCRKAKPDKRTSQIIKGRRIYLNLDGTPSKNQPAKYFDRRQVFRDAADMANARERAMQDYAEIEGARAGTVTTQKNPNIFWTCPNCWMRDICELHEVGQDWAEMLRLTTKSWDPYAEHEIYNGR